MPESSTIWAHRQSGGQIAATPAEPLVTEDLPLAMIAYKGHDHSPLAKLIAGKKAQVAIPFSANAKMPWEIDADLY